MYRILNKLREDTKITGSVILDLPWIGMGGTPFFTKEGISQYSEFKSLLLSGEKLSKRVSSQRQLWMVRWDADKIHLIGDYGRGDAMAANTWGDKDGSLALVPQEK